MTHLIFLDLSCTFDGKESIRVGVPFLCDEHSQSKGVRWKHAEERFPIRGSVANVTRIWLVSAAGAQNQVLSSSDPLNLSKSAKQKPHLVNETCIPGITTRSVFSIEDPLPLSPSCTVPDWPFSIVVVLTIGS